MALLGRSLLASDERGEQPSMVLLPLGVYA
jgi:hypothetical protein